MMVESYRNEQELFNLQCWALTCEAFFDTAAWICYTSTSVTSATTNSSTSSELGSSFHACTRTPLLVPCGM